ncbi:MAG TPA: hypothetical protein VFT13_13985 [Candidatus Krumholzibacteria bacterium]|nr:hypothetical protein [Candidatus Krumholzibacteria bacterium]
MVYGKGLLLIAAASLLVAGCGDQRQRQFRQEKRQFAIVMKSKLNQFDRRAAELAVQVQTDSLHTLEVDSLRLSHDEFRGRIAAIDGATASQWKEIKPAMEAEYYDLERRYYEIAGAVAAQQAIEASVDTLTAGDAGEEPREDVVESAGSAKNTPADAVSPPDSVADAAGALNR